MQSYLLLGSPAFQLVYDSGVLDGLNPVQCYGPVCVTCYSFWRGAVLRVTAFGGAVLRVTAFGGGCVTCYSSGGGCVTWLRPAEQPKGHSKVALSRRIFLRLRRASGGVNGVLSRSACLLPGLLRWSCLALPALRFSLSFSSCAMVHEASLSVQWRRRRQPSLRWPLAQPACRQPHPRHLTR